MFFHPIGGGGVGPHSYCLDFALFFPKGNGVPVWRTMMGPSEVEIFKTMFNVKKRELGTT